MSDSRRFTVEYDPKAVKELKRLDRSIARRITRAVDDLADDPRPRGTRSLVGFPEFWRGVGDHRVIYTIRETEVIVLVVRVAHRSKVYRGL